MSTNSSEPTTVADEIAAMRRIVAALERLDADSRSRVVAWLADRYRYDLDMPDLIRVPTVDALDGAS